MIYLKFTGVASDNPAITDMVICTKRYAVSRDVDGIRIHHDNKAGAYETVSPTCWLNCFVMSEQGKTIDKYEA